MGPVDKVLSRKEERCRKRQLVKETCRKKEAEQMQQAATTEFSSSSDVETEASNSDDDIDLQKNPAKPK